MKRLTTVLLAAIAMTQIVSDAHAAAYDELNAAEKSQIQSGNTVLKSQDVPGSDWPKVTVYLRVNATPEEVAAVFADAEQHVRYGFPGVKKSHISKRHSPAKFEVDYTLWPLGNVDWFAEDYTTLDSLSAYDNGASYLVGWQKVKATSTKQIIGNARFERLGTATILAYHNFVIPGDGLAKYAKDGGIDAVKKTAEALRNQTEKERKSAPEVLKAQVAKLRAALGR